MNGVVAENSLPGAPRAAWDLKDRPGDRWGVGDSSIEGFATETSVDRDATVSFKVSTAATAYHLDIYRLGFYQGLGARHVATVQPSAALPQAQPGPVTVADTGLLDCGNWAVSASWDVPVDAVSGVYLAKLVRDDGVLGANHIPFVVRRDDGSADVLFQTSDTTWQAYNTWGGRSLYSYSGPAGDPLNGVGRAYAVSYNRPLMTRSTEWGLNYLFAAEYPMIRFLEANGFDVEYCAGADVDRSGASLLRHRAFLAVGHDEYWSAGQRDNVVAARDGGVHLAFCTGNQVYWRTRWEPGAGGGDHRTLVCYKETHANKRIDPSGEWTGTWRDNRFGPAVGGQPENGLTGTITTRAAGIGATAIRVPAEYASHRFWHHTDISDRADPVLAVATLGYEWDGDADNGHRPPGLMRLSSTTEDWNPQGRPAAQLGPSERTYILQDQGTVYSVGTATHHLTLYRHQSGALVFSAGTVKWACGLDADHDVQGLATGPADPAMRQAMVNLFADMGVQPGSLDADLVAGEQAAPGPAPASTISEPAHGATLTPGRAVTVSGTATAPNGVVAAVEVSVNGGASWHPADGLDSWALRWTPTGNGTVRLLSRAVDDSGAIEVPGVATEVAVGACEGAPLLLVVDGGFVPNPFGEYWTEILRGEGLVGFAKIELRELAALTDAEAEARLASFAVVLLAETRLPEPTQTLLRAYVAAGGRLVAMRPDPALADLFGLEYAQTQPEPPAQPLQYFAFATASGPGVGITSQSLTYHGLGDRYASAGARVLAWFQDQLDSPSTHPAVTVHEHGRGRAVCCAFDLARDIVLSRQGNPDWKNSEGDGVHDIGVAEIGAQLQTNAETRPMDMFTRLPSFDAAGTRIDPGAVWFEPLRLRIPHADEKQRFLANLLLTLIDRPTPRLWYLPGGHRSIVVNTGDGESYDEATLRRPIDDAQARGGRFTTFLTRGQIPWPPPEAGEASVAAVAAWEAAGHETGVHVYNKDVGPEDIQTYGRLSRAYSDIVEALRQAYGHGSRTARSHTIDWVGWTEMAAIEAANGTGLDLNYYHFWEEHSATVPTRLGRSPGRRPPTGYFTGSGLPQRFIDETGAVLPIFQLLTEWPDEFFYNNDFDPDSVFAEVIAPMLASAESGCISAFVTNVHPAPYWTPQAGYGTAQRTSRWVHKLWDHAQSEGVPMWTAENLLDFAQARTATSFDRVAWTGTELTFDVIMSDPGPEQTIMLPAAGLRSVQLDGTAVLVTSSAFAGRDYALVACPGAATVRAEYWRTFLDTTSADFNSGTLEAVRTVEVADGAVILSGDGPVDGPDERGASRWEFWPASGDLARTATWQVVGTRLVHELNADVATYHPALLPAEAAPTLAFSLGCRQRVTQVADAPGAVGALGFVLGGQDAENYWEAQYAQGGLGVRLYRRHSGHGTFILIAEAPLADPEVGRWYAMRLDVAGDTVRLFVDGVLCLSASDPELVPGRVGVLGYQGSAAEYDDVLLTSSVDQAGIYTSRTFDAGGPAEWGPVETTADVPADTLAVLRVRTGDTPAPDESWTTFGPPLVTGAGAGSVARYAQYHMVLATTNPRVTPRLDEVRLTYADPA
jgi:hypothetical protein